MIKVQCSYCGAETEVDELKEIPLCDKCKKLFDEFDGENVNETSINI